MLLPTPIKKAANNKFSSNSILKFSSILVIASGLCACVNPASRNRAEQLDKIRFITSSEGNYWQAASVIEGGKAAEITIDTQLKFQTWHGTGGTFNELGWQVMQSLDESDREKIMSLLFNSDEGIGFSWGRIPMGASDFAIDRYTLSDIQGDMQIIARSDSLNDLELNNFSIERDQQHLIPYIRAAKKASANTKFWASPWTPPSWMKDNNRFDRGAFNPAYAQNALIVVNAESKQYKITPAYYVFRHFGQYIQEGARRIAVYGGNGLAFENPDNSIVFTLYNKENKDKTLSVKLAEKTLTLTVPARGWGTLVYP